MLMTISIILSIIANTEYQQTVYAGKDSEKELCKENGGKWKDGECDFDTDDEDKADQFMEDVEKVNEFEDEEAPLEDALCDDEDAETTNIDICSSQDLKLDQVFAEK